MTDNLRGAMLMSVCMAGYGVNDAMMKLASSGINLGQALFLRGLVATSLLALLCWYWGGFKVPVAWRDRRLMIYRIVGEVGGTYCFLQALFNMPIANATAILQSLPLAVALAGAIFLRERVGWRRYTAILVGFGGVMLIVKPGTDGFDAYGLWALGAVGFIVLRDLLTRQFSTSVPSVLVATVTAFNITIMGAVIIPFQEWRPLMVDDLTLVGGAAVFLIAGYLFSVTAMRTGDIAFISPFRYTILIWAIVLGIVLFGHVPDTLSFVGAGIVVATGIYTFYREQQRTRLAVTHPVAGKSS